MKALSLFLMAGLATAITIELDSMMSFGTNSLSEIDSKFI